MFLEWVLEIIQRAERGEPVELPTGDWGLLLYESLVNYFAKPDAKVAKRPEMKKVRAVLVSGGMDSTVAYHMALAQSEVDGVPVRAYYMRISTGYEERELRALEEAGITPEVIELPIEHDWDRWGYIIPGRNLAFILAVAERLNREGFGGEVWMASLDGEWKPSGNDKSLVFTSAVNRVLAALPYPFELRTPLKDKTKTDLVAWWRARGLPLEQLLATRTCQSETEEHCGRCQACFNRWVGLQNNNLADQQVWLAFPPDMIGEDQVVTTKVREAVEIVERGYALATEEQSYKSASEIVRALESAGVDYRGRL